MTDAFYVHAIVRRDSELPPAMVGFDGRPLEVFPHGELAAVVSQVDPAELQPTTEAVLKHEEVVEGLRESAPLLPVRFGTLFPDEDGVLAGLSRQYDTLLADLHRLGDKVEFGLTALWPEEASDGEREGSAPNHMPASSTTPATPGPGTRYLQERVAEQRRSDALRLRAQALAELLEADLAPFILDSRRTIAPTPRIAVRAAYLLHPTNIQAYYEAFEGSRKTHPELRFLLNGPWPPYSFVSTSGPDRGALSTGRSLSSGQDQQEEVAHG